MNEYIATFLTITRHRENLADLLEELANELRHRARRHDRSKLTLELFEGFAEINRVARELPFGSPEYTASLKKANREGGCVARHFATESHHPEYHQPGQMGFLDIIEMVLDWQAASLTYGQNSFEDSLPIQRERFADTFTSEQWWLIEQVASWLANQA